MSIRPQQRRCRLVTVTRTVIDHLIHALVALPLVVCGILLPDDQ
jgi:hypothetical protein